MKFPTLANSGKAEIKGKKITFTYLDSYAKAQTETKPLLDEDEIIELVDKRKKTFYDSPAGARESDELRSDRKYIAAHPIDLLKSAFEKMDEDQKMEFDMMLSHSSHHGISDPDEVEEYEDPQKTIPFAGRDEEEEEEEEEEPKKLTKASIIDHLTPEEDY